MVAVHDDLDRRLIRALHLARLAGPLPLDPGVATDSSPTNQDRQMPQGRTKA